MIRDHQATQYFFFFPSTPRTRNTAKTTAHHAANLRRTAVAPGGKKQKKTKIVLQSERERKAASRCEKNLKTQPTAGGKQESQTLNETESVAFAAAVRG